MAHFLFKPHIVGPTNNITTPDIVVDRVAVAAAKERQYVPVHHLSTDAEIQTFAGDLAVTPAYALVACGGGAILSLAAQLRHTETPRSAADLLLARSAWRLRDVIDHVGSLELSIKSGSATASVPVSRLTQPQAVMAQLGDGQLVLPRGVIVLCAAVEAEITVSAPAPLTARIFDPGMDRGLARSAALSPVDADRWLDRPLPRYTVGPVGDVEHYI